MTGEKSPFSVLTKTPSENAEFVTTAFSHMYEELRMVVNLTDLTYSVYTDVMTDGKENWIRSTKLWTKLVNV